MLDTADLTVPASWTSSSERLANEATSDESPPHEASPPRAPSNEPPAVESSSTGTLSNEALESELVGLAGHLAAGHCRWLLLLAEFDTRDGWAGPGLRSCAHWLNWRVGMNLRTGFEQVRVAHALSELPAVTAAFAAGRISYSKVRAITRVATPATEGTLLDLALAGTASHVERVVRHARQATADPIAAARRELSWRWNDDGTLDLRGRFTAEQGTRLITAINALTEPPRITPCACGESGRSSKRGTPGDDSSVESDATAGCTGDGGPGSDGSAGDHVVGNAIADSDHGGGVVGGLRSAEHHSGRVVASARLAEHHGGGVVGGLRSAEHHGDCETEPIAARRADALVTLVEGERRADPQLIVIVDANPRGGATPARLQGGPAIPMRAAERIGCNARVRALLRSRRGNPLHLGRTRRLVSPAQMTALQIRDHGRCQFPGCDHTLHLQAHHIVAWLRGGRTDLDNLVLICGQHHQLIHDHGYRIHGRGAELTFLRPDGHPIDPAGAPTRGEVEALIAGHSGVPIDGDTITPTWFGERLDVSGILASLLPDETWQVVA